MDALINYLIDNLMLDFQGDLTMEMVQDFLGNDKSKEAKTLLDKLLDDHDTSNMMITLADCLKEYLRNGINERLVREQIMLYAES